MKTIWKFKLPVTDQFTIEMPVGAVPLSVQVQDPDGEGFVCLWCLVDPHAPKERRAFRVIGTGHPIESAELLDYIGTFQLRGGALVFHLFGER